MSDRFSEELAKGQSYANCFIIAKDAVSELFDLRDPKCRADNCCALAAGIPELLLV